MIIGIDYIGATPFDIGVAPVHSSYIELKNSVVDELHIQSQLSNSSTKENWTNGTILLAKFNGDLEAGNITMRENPISKLRIKRRNYNSTIFKVLKEMPFNPDPTELIYDDYTCVSDDTYDYSVVPVDSAGIEGIMTAVSVKPHVEGWWIIDRDNPGNHIKFMYNLDEVSISTDEDRTELSTFSRYPKVYYGTKRAKRGSLSGLFIPEGMTVRDQIAMLENLTQQHKPLLLKGGYGRSYIVDVSAPQLSIAPMMKDITKVNISWVEVEQFND